jgi:hypothetical protein
VEPAASIVALPEIEREPSRISRHAPIEERRESQSSDKDEEKAEELYVADEVTFPDGGWRVSTALSSGGKIKADRQGVAVCGGSLVDRILRLRSSGHHGRIPDIISIDVFI